MILVPADVGGQNDRVGLTYRWTIGMNSSRRMLLRSLLILAATVGSVFWLLFSFSEFPWIVPADSIGPGETAAKSASAAAFSLGIMSLIAICLIAGFFGTSRTLLIAAACLVTAQFFTSWWLYPSPDLLDYPVRLGVHILGGIVLVTGSYLTFWPDKPRVNPT